jgi:CTP:molybdopterin cytidylyltransferase MocA
MKYGAVILTAGYSSRMGHFKPLMPLSGKSMLAHCVSLFRSAGVDEIVVVTGHRCDEVIPPAEELGALCVYNSAYEEGMFGSICLSLQHYADVDGVFILPVDIPLIRPATVDLLLSRFTGESVVYPSFAGERGHPPLIPASFIPAILKHDGRGGLQALLEKLPATDVAVWDQGIMMDADTPEDYEALIGRAATMETGTSAEAEVLAELTMPPRGVAHGRAVAAIAISLGEELNRHGLSLDLNLLSNSGLLHDIAKGLPDHEREGAEMLRRLGLGNLSESVGLHRDACLPASGTISEKELVCLADKLVRGTRRMSIEERFAEKLHQYADDQSACTAIHERLDNALALKQLVAKLTGMSVEEILQTQEI